MKNNLQEHINFGKIKIWLLTMELKNIIIFVGRPNAGKSSLIRKLTGVKTRIGKSAGTTKKFVYYYVERFVVVDFPGFGKISHASKRVIEQIKNEIVSTIEKYQENIRLALHVIDGYTFFYTLNSGIKKQMIPLDIELAFFLRELQIDTITVINKIDKIKKRELDTKIQLIYKALGYNGYWRENKMNFIPVSIKKNYGIITLIKALNAREIKFDKR